MAESPAAAARKRTSVNSDSSQSRSDDGSARDDKEHAKTGRHSRIMSGNEVAPLKILSPRGEAFSPENAGSPMRSARKSLFGDRRFPVKIGTGTPGERSPARASKPAPRPEPEQQPEPSKIDEEDEHVPGEMTLEQALARNEGLRNAIQNFDDDDDDDDEEDDASTTLENGSDDADEMADKVTDLADRADESGWPDDTAFSNFSIIPNLTNFAGLSVSPAKGGASETNATPKPYGRRGTSPPKDHRTARPDDAGNTTSLLDFTDHLASISSRYADPSPSRRGPGKAGDPSDTPRRNQDNLLDFDIPPMPTPRSIPTVTPREIEALKSAFLSEISSLKATLSGKEAEVTSLKTAVGDAEKRVSQFSEQLREVEVLKNSLSEERDTWQSRGREMESILRKVKSEMVHSQREREELEFKLVESEQRREAAEMMAQDAESKMASLRAGRAAPDADNVKSPSKTASQREADNMERVARELHALYKTKHETKVAALKKSYEARWEKRIREMERTIEELTEENESLKTDRDSTMTKAEFGQAVANETAELKAQAAKSAARVKELDTEVQKLEAIIGSVKQDNQELIILLERERVEKGELVQLAEEMMSIQQQQPPAPTPAPKPQPQPRVMSPKPMSPQPMSPEPAPARQTPKKIGGGIAPPTNFRTSIGKPPSGLRTPVGVPKPAPSKIGGPPPGHHRTTSAAPPRGLPRPGSVQTARPQSMVMPRSGIMSSIEKMGNYRGRGE